MDHLNVYATMATANHTLAERHAQAACARLVRQVRRQQRTTYRLGSALVTLGQRLQSA